MSLFSYINSTSTQSSSSYASSVYTSALEQLTAAKASLDGSTGGAASTGNGVTISTSATIAAATKADAKKDSATLTAEIRKALDASYKESGTKKPDVSEMSPRALATIVLNQSGTFSRAEMLTAKAELRSRDRATLLEAISGGLDLDSLEAYQTARTTSYASMSTEERAVRGVKD